MLIKEIGIRNFQSFGNVRQTITLNTEHGELILLSAPNGGGKSSVGAAIDFTCYKKVKGKNKKSVTLSNLPNRINKELVTDITYVANNTKYYVERGINPNYIKLSENDMPFDDKAGAGIIDEKIVKSIGLDFETFKSFISMSINDFKNFISLSNEDKKVLLDKMFNLEYLNLLNGVLKNIISENKKSIDLYTREINTLNESIEEINFSLEKTKHKLQQKVVINYENVLAELKTSFIQKKEALDKHQLNLNKAKIKQAEIKSNIDTQRISYIETTQSIKNIETKLKLYDSGKCPTCESDLNSDFHNSIKNDLKEQHSTLIKIKNQIEIDNKELKINEDKIGIYFNKANNLVFDLNNQLKSIKKQRDEIIQKQKNISLEVLNDTSLDEFTASIQKLTNKKNDIKNTKINEENKAIYHKVLSNILGEDGVKQVIIRNIIMPINNFVNDNAILLNLPFNIELTENFDAVITHFGDEINSETLSTGEMRKVNLCIMIAYLKLIRTKININILFLDEIFASIDIDSINDVITLLRDFANEYNINIFIVHHSQLDYNKFDRVINITKDVFSVLNEIKINEQ